MCLTMAMEASEGERRETNTSKRNKKIAIEDTTMAMIQSRIRVIHECDLSSLLWSDGMSDDDGTF